MLFRNGRGSPHVIPNTSGCNKKSIMWTIVLVEMLPGVVSQGSVQIKYETTRRRPGCVQITMALLEHV